MKDYYQDCKEFEMEGIKYFLLQMRCPHCLERDYSTVMARWQCAKCGGDIYLGDNATFYCSKCHETIPCSLANYHCPNHGYMGPGYKISRSNEINYFNFCSVHMGVLMDMGGPAFLIRFLQILDNQKKEYDKFRQQM